MTYQILTILPIGTIFTYRTPLDSFPGITPPLTEGVRGTPGKPG